MEHKEEEERRHVAAYKEETEKKLERACRAKAAMEENPDALRKGKWHVALSSLHYLLVLWFIHEQYCLLLDFLLCCHVMHFKYGHA